MFQFSDLTIETAVANQSGAMDARDHFKNGASLKSQMSRGNFLSYLVILAFALMAVFTSCDDDGNSDDIVKLPETITYDGGDYVKFEYDSQNRITKILNYNKNRTPTSTETFTYSGDDLVKYVYEYPEYSVITTEEYAKNGNQITITYYGDEMDGGTNILDISNDGYPVKYDFILHNLGVINNYTIQNGNVITINSVQEHWEITEKEGSVNYKYDDKKSPFTYCETPKWWMIIDRGLAHEYGCKNNVIEENKSNVYWKGSNANGKTEYTYEYDSDDYPTKRRVKQSDGKVDEYTFKYK